jgi:acyl carrier protein
MHGAEVIAEFIGTRFRTKFGGRAPGVDEPLISSGVIDSFGVLELIAFLEDSFHVTIDPARQELTEFETVNRIADVVERARRGGS